MVQLWVNLPAASKMSAPSYQGLTSSEITVVKLGNEAGQVRVIAGKFHGVTGSAKTHSRIGMLDVQIAAGHEVVFGAAAGDTVIVFLRSGRLQFGADEFLEEQGVAVMSSREADFALTAVELSQCLVLIGEPLNEPINGHGPFVMNTYDEVLQAYEDIKHDRFLG